MSIHIHSKLLYRACAVLCAATLASSCGAKTGWRGGPVPTSQDRAGSAQVSILSIAPWDEYVSALQPNFAMDEERALKEAIPNTLSIDRQITDALGFGLKLALPSTSSASSDTTTANRTSTSAAENDKAASTRATSEATASSVRTDATVPGDVSKIQTPTALVPSAAPNPAASPLDTVVTIDPFVRYTAATALFQEVRVLQRYIRDALIGSGQRAFVVRLQVTLMPAQRHQPLDAYTTLSFFGTGGTSLTGQVAPAGQVFRPLGRANDPFNRQVKTYEVQVKTNANVRVVPLLVSDNLEGALESASTSVLRRFAFGLLGMLGNAGVSADVSRAVERLQSMVGRELNSLMTVGQISDNTIRVRFGAMNQPDSEIAMVSRTQKVTLLVVAPEGSNAEAIRVASKTDFFNGTDGSQLQSQTRRLLQQRIDVALKNYGVDADESDASIAKMVATVQAADVDGFKEALTHLKDDGTNQPLPAEEIERLLDMSDTLWVDVAAILSTLPYSVTTVQLPKTWVATVPKQTPLAIDDGKKLSIVIGGASTLRGSDLYAFLPIGPNHGELAATSITIDGRGYAALGFPSPTGSGLCVDRTPAVAGGAEACNPGQLRLCRIPGRWEVLATPESPREVCQRMDVVYRTASEVKIPTPAAYAIAVGPRVVLADRGAGSLAVRVMKMDSAARDAKVVLKIDGGDVVLAKAVDENGGVLAIAAKSGGYELTSAATVTFELKNLHPTVAVVITGAGAEKPDRYELRVENQPSAPPKQP